MCVFLQLRKLYQRNVQLNRSRFYTNSTELWHVHCPCEVLTRQHKNKCVPHKLVGANNNATVSGLDKALWKKKKSLNCTWVFKLKNTLYTHKYLSTNSTTKVCVNQAHKQHLKTWKLLLTHTTTSLLSVTLKSSYTSSSGKLSLLRGGTGRSQMYGRPH